MPGYEEFSDSRLVELYDLLNPPGPETEFFLSLPHPADRTVLDVGCGTGSLAVALAGRGLAVTGADPSPMMLRVARHRQEGGAAVDWIESTAAGLELTTRFDLALMTNHVFQFFLTDEAVADSLAAIRRHLAPGGRLAFETRNPACEAWLRWNRHDSMRTVIHPEHGPVTSWVEVDDVAGELVHFRLIYEFAAAGSQAVSHNTLRFLDVAAVSDHLGAAGFTITGRYGDWDRSPLQAACPEIIVIAAAAS